MDNGDAGFWLGEYVSDSFGGHIGGLMGLEREWRGRDAGLRTNMLIAMGACLFTVISLNGFPLEGSSARDTARVAAQVVTGVGFLGAGAFIHAGGQTKGMTTAATIWMVAAIGMAVGVQAYVLAGFSGSNDSDRFAFPTADQQEGGEDGS